MTNTLKVSVFSLALIPLLLLGYDVLQEYQQPGSALGAEPAEAVVRWLGNWAVRLLLLTLAISSLTRLTSLAKLITVRRMLGLFAFAYACLHLLAYVFLLAGGDLGTVLDDFIKRPYITAGLTAFLLLLPLAVTSTGAWQRRLRRNWMRLHRLIYPAAIVVVVHILWLAKGSYFDSFLYSAVLGVLLLERIYSRQRKQDLKAAALGT